MRSTIGRYKIIEEIGRGAMGVVYKAHDPRIDRIVAIKTIRKQTDASDPEASSAQSRFEREARAAGKLSHPGIVTVFDVVEDADEVYIAMEFVEGRSLRARITDEHTLPFAEAVGIVVQVCDALAYAHAHHVVHRDVKPDNILCLADGTVKLADFGIARVTTSTATHSVIGTPRYMAPEQWRGEVVDRRADVFAAGVMLTELLTGQAPFAGNTSTALMYAVMHDHPKLPAQIDAALPPAIDAIAARALAREPAQRYDSAAEMAETLAELVASADAGPVVIDPIRLTILRRGDVHFLDLADTGTLIPRSETRVDASFMQDIAAEVERVAAGRVGGRGGDATLGTTIDPEAAPPRTDGLPTDRLSQLQAIGQLMYSHLLTEPARQKIASSEGADLYLRLDEQLVHVPWELCYDGHDFLVNKFRVGRQVITERQLPRRAPAATAASTELELLIVADPTQDLRGAQDESIAIESQLAGTPGLRVTRMVGATVRKVPLLQALSRCSIVHFAGHSVYDADDPTQSGWVVSDGVLTAGEMTKLDRLPVLVFSNSCHAGATVGWDGQSSYEGQAFGIGSAFLLAGVQNYVGTFWITHDDESALFARAFYQAALGGSSIGEALQGARQRVLDQCGWNELTWASYMLYGDPAYQLPMRRRPTVPTPTSATTIVRPGAGLSDTQAETVVPARAPGTRTRLVAALGGVAVLVLAWALLRPDTSPEPRDTTPAPTAVATVVAKPTPPPLLGRSELPKVYLNLLATLDSATEGKSAKLQVVKNLVADESDPATRALLESIGNSEILIGMSAISGLSGRPCRYIEAPLTARLLDDPEPKRRAWAAKVLGDTGCVGALDALSTHLASEKHEMVQTNVRTAIKSLEQARTKGTQ